MFKLDLSSGNIVAKEYIVVIDGEPLYVEDVVKLYAEVVSLREENVKLNQDRSALHNINEGLQKQVNNYQDIIANNTTSIRCKELEKENDRLKQNIKELHEVLARYECSNKAMNKELDCLKQTVKDLEEVIRDDDLMAQSDEVDSLQTAVRSLENSYVELLGLFHNKLDEVKEQKHTIDFLNRDIECVVKLNIELQKRLEDYEKGLYFGIYSVR